MPQAPFIVFLFLLHLRLAIGAFYIKHLHFACEACSRHFFNENVVSQYTYEESVTDGVNVPYDVYTIETEISQEGAIIESGWFIDRRDKLTRQKRWQQLRKCELAAEPPKPEQTPWCCWPAKKSPMDLARLAASTGVIVCSAA